MLVADVLQSCVDHYEPLDLWKCVNAKATHERLLQCAQDPTGRRQPRDMNEWEKLKRYCCRYAALMRVLASMQGSQQGAASVWSPQLVVVRETKLKDNLVVGAEDEKKLLACEIMKGQEAESRYLWIHQNCIVLGTPHPSEMQRMIVRASYGLNRLKDAQFLPREHPDRSRCLLLTVRPTVQHLESVAEGKHAAISALVSESLIHVEVFFKSEDRAVTALELVLKSHTAFREQQKFALERALLSVYDLSE